MNACMPPSRPHDLPSERTGLVDASPPARRLGLFRALLRLASVRQQREACALARAEKPLRRALVELDLAQRELVRLRRRVTASSPDSCAGSPPRETSGRDIALAYAARAEREARFAAQAERVAGCARGKAQAQATFDDARARYSQACRRQHHLRRWLRDMQASGNP